MKTAIQKNAISWFDLPATNFDRAKKFYSTILDAEVQEMMMGNIRMGFFPCDMNEGVGGAIVEGEGFTPNATGTMVYLNGGEDLRRVLNRVEEAGGEIIVPKTQISLEHGYFAIFMDTEGNKVGLHSMN